MRGPRRRCLSGVDGLSGLGRLRLKGELLAEGRGREGDREDGAPATAGTDGQQGDRDEQHRLVAGATVPEPSEPSKRIVQE